MNLSAQRKIMVFAHDSLLYGASLSLLTVLEHLSGEESINLLIILPYEGKIEYRLNALKIKYKIVPFPRCVTNQSNSLIKRIQSLLYYYRQLFKVFPILQLLAKEFEPDLIYSNTSAVSIGYLLAKKIKVPHIWHVREYFEDGHHLSYLPSRNFITNKIRKSDVSIFASNILRTLWVASNKGNYKVIYNGLVSTHLGNNKPRLQSSISKFGLLGYIVPGKGHEMAILGFSKIIDDFPNSELHFYGDISDWTFFNYLQKLISNLECDRKILFHPFIEDNSNIYKNLQVLLSCSTFEGIGRTIVEAMSLGIPVIANTNEGNKETICNGETGLLFNNTPEGLSEEMISLISDNNLYNKISQNAIIKVHKEFSVERYVNDVTSIIISSMKFS